MRPAALEQRYGAAAPPRWPLATADTPLEALAPGGVPLLVKGEGCAHPVYGGNKVRKLEWVLGALRAAERPPRTVLTAGAAGSHHVVATAIHAAAAGLRTHALVAPQRASADARRHLRLSAHRCARLTAVAGPTEIPRLVADLVAEGPSVAWLPIGGSSAAGTLGAVDLGLELAAQLDGRRPARVVVALGSGGTAVGLALGLTLAGVAVPVEAVRVSPAPFGRRRRLRRMMAAAARLLPDGAGAVDAAMARLQVRHDRVGAGYATPDPRAAQARRAAAAVGLATEDTYSARALSAALDGGPGPVVFVATANARPLDGLLADAPPLTPALEALLEGA